jgi:glutamate-5-semialdehyde dehydrogenase
MEVKALARAVHEAYLAFLDQGTTKVKNEILLAISEGLARGREELMAENRKDLDAGERAGLSKAMLDRLALTEKRIDGMITAMQDVAALPDPVGRIYDMNVRPEGFRVGRMRVPIGVIGIIYEARPNVTVEASGLCIKSGNATVLRGGSSALHSNMALVKIIKAALLECGVDDSLVGYVDTPSRDAVDEMLVQDEHIHLIIPRGGESLIRRVVEKSTIPVLKHYKGVCHTYVNEKADLKMALRLTLNGKVQRPAVCNATETLLVDQAVAAEFCPRALSALQEQGVEIRGCERTRAIYSKDVVAATEDDWTAEYLDLILAVKIVDDIDDAIAHINRYGSAHTETIVTRDIATADKFTRRVDSSSVIVNATTRLSDGGVYGLGAEIGISTDKLHARGPMGLEELTTYKWIVQGDGHIRE